MRNESIFFLSKDSVSIYSSKKKKNMNVSIEDFITGLKKKKISINRTMRLKKNTVFILEDEELVIRNLKLPKIPRNEINGVLNYKLKIEFGDLSKIIEYSYKIISEDAKNINIIMYCINRTCMERIVRCNKVGKIKAVHIIQEYFADIVISLINDENFSLVYSYKNYFFYDEYYNSILVKEKRISKDEILETSFLSFINSCKVKSKLEHLYCINIEVNNLDEVSNKINVINLGFYDRKQLISV